MAKGATLLPTFKWRSVNMEIVLSNGLTVRHIPSLSRGKKLRCALTVRAGSLNETIPGTAHLLEHMLLLFDKISGHYNKSVYSVGGRTYWDRTNYLVACNTNQLNKVAMIFAGICSGTYLDEKLIHYAKSDVKEEIVYRMREQGIQKEKILLMNVLDSSVKMPMGNLEGIDNINITHLKEYFKTYYTPENMCISIVGNIDISEFVELFNRYNSSVTSKKKYSLGYMCDLKKSENEKKDENKKESDDIEIYFKLEVAPFFENNECLERVILYLMCYALDSLPENEKVFIGIKEFTKDYRFIYIKIENMEYYKCDKLLKMLNKKIREYGNDFKMEISQFVKEKLREELEGIYDVLLVKRSIDFFVYGCQYYDVLDLKNKIERIDSIDIKRAISIILETKPIIITSKYNIYEKWSSI